ncbi:MAG: gliding motility-associated C-terminal domain-containing protein [Bacteroidales bacterium]|nr:gliding motility-associated C-terminal domain-containing protein [Bacteroidales bacterium]
MLIIQRLIGGLLILANFLVGLNTYAQKEGLNWYFGLNAGLRFHEGYPQALTDGALSTVEGCSTISSPEGDLLFYTDGITVYNRLHQIMPNGDDLMGSPDATQSGVIVPVPNDTNLYYIFTVSSLGVAQPMDGFRYTMVDMRLNEGYGGIIDVTKNTMIYPAPTERITSVFHENDYGIWVIMHEWESSRFRSYLVTTDGIDIDQPVISDVGLYHGPENNSNRNGIGYLKVSPDGSKLAVAIMGKNVVEVFDFDHSTGVVSNAIILPVDTVPYGVEFSASAEFLYATERLGNKVYQWDMQQSTPEDIINSREIIGTLASNFGGALQMAADGRIYIARKTRLYLSVIKYPYLKGTACSFKEMGVELPVPRASKEGLPTFIQSYFNNIWILCENVCINETFKFALNSVINLDSVMWNFNDPASGMANMSALLEPEHIFSSPGYYEVQVICYHLTTQTVISEKIEVLPLPDVDLGNDMSMCQGDSVTLRTGTGFNTIKWMDNADLYDTAYKVSEEGNYWVQVSNYCGVDFDTVYVEVYDLPEIDLGKDTTVKYQEPITIDAGPGFVEYLWQNGANGREIKVDYPGYYWVEVMDGHGCISSDTINIEPVKFQIFFPTAFSPNGDEYNPVFIPKTTYDVDIEYELKIFDRWGQLVFESKNIHEGWDGTYNSNPCPMEVYTWFMNASTFESNEFFIGPYQQTGNVTLLR